VGTFDILPWTIHDWVVKYYLRYLDVHPS
jgi:hypothetical protein